MYFMELPEIKEAISPWSFLQTQEELQEHIQSSPPLLFAALAASTGQFARSLELILSWRNKIYVTNPNTALLKTALFLEFWVKISLFEKKDLEALGQELLALSNQEPENEAYLCLLENLFTKTAQPLPKRAAPAHVLLEKLTTQIQNHGKLSLGIFEEKGVRWGQQLLGAPDLLLNLGNVLPHKINEFTSTQSLGKVKQVKISWQEALLQANFADNQGLALLGPTNAELPLHIWTLTRVLAEGEAFDPWPAFDPAHYAKKNLSNLNTAALLAANTLEECLGFLNLDKNVYAACLINKYGELLFPENKLHPALHKQIVYFWGCSQSGGLSWPLHGKVPDFKGQSFFIDSYFLRFYPLGAWTLVLVIDNQLFIEPQLSRLAQHIQSVLPQESLNENNNPPKKANPESAFRVFWERELILQAFTQISSKGVLLKAACKESVKKNWCDVLSVWLRSRCKSWEETEGLGSFKGVQFVLEKGIINLIRTKDQYLITLAYEDAHPDWVSYKSRQLETLI